jgi:NAD(P)-dependent dehydrogenase (short-subunit alcohol dehydrogenase family)
VLWFTAARAGHAALVPPSSPRTVLVTGANGGIGLATVLELARAGFDAVGTVRSEEAGKEVARAAADAGVAVRTTELDVDDEDACRRVIDAEAPWGLVNNAGYAQSGAITEVDDDEARAQLETLVLAPARLARLASGPMRAAGGGRVVNVSSIAAEISTPLLGWYQAAKKALEGISDAMRMELGPDGIDVVLIQPGTIQTGIWDDTRQRLDRPTRYGRSYEAFRSLTKAFESHMASPSAVADVIRRALEAKRPRDRYPVGLDAQVLTRVGRFVPVPVTDAATRLLLKLR